MRFTYYIFLFCMGFAACKSNEKKVSKEPLYPFPQYIKSQIAYVDSAQLGIEMIVTENGVTTDSGFISREVFNKLASEFSGTDPNDNSIRDLYEETSFKDLTLNTVTFSISAKDTSLPLQQAEVLLNPDTKQVKYLVIKKQFATNDGKAISSMMWRHNQNFQIATQVVTNDKIIRTKKIRVVWDKPAEELIRY